MEKVSQYKLLHSQSKDYGTSSILYLQEIEMIIEYLQPKTLLDYGCGKGILDKALEQKYPNISVYGYDPAIQGKDVLPPLDSYDLIVNTDVLEHIPENEIDEVLKKISTLSPNCIFGLYHALAGIYLPNGENAHCTVHSIIWWFDKLSKHFPCLTILEGHNPYTTLVLTFPIDGNLWNAYEQMLIKEKLLKYLRCLGRICIPSFVKPVLSPVYKFLERRIVK